MALFFFIVLLLMGVILFSKPYWPKIGDKVLKYLDNKGEKDNE